LLGSKKFRLNLRNFDAKFHGATDKELVAVDGTKIRANSSRRNSHTQKGTKKEFVSAEKKISEYMSELESNDAYEFCLVHAKFVTEAGERGVPLDSCYNVQAVADAKHKLIVDFDVSTCPNDKGILRGPSKIHKVRCIK
jgi:hypothetical protein